jgi:hypothetical protein
MRFLSVVRCRTRCNLNRASSRSRRIVGSGSQIAGTRSRHDSSASTRASILSVLHASGASPLTFLASATNTSQPASSSVSCTNRAPFIDSITARTRRPPTRRANPRRPSASVGAANSAIDSPPPDKRQTSRRRRLRSNPACNMKRASLCSFLDHTPERVTEEALFHRSPLRQRWHQRRQRLPCGRRSRVAGARRHSVVPDAIATAGAERDSGIGWPAQRTLEGRPTRCSPPGAAGRSARRT